MSETARSAARPRPLDGMSILVVDDEEDVVDLVAHVLTSAGAVVRTASGAADAMEVLVADPHADLIVSDLMMPHEDGCSLLRRVRALAAFRALPALALSGAAAELGARARAAGFDVVESKPIVPRRLVERVMSLLAIPTVAR